jgi:uncharacterized protein (TIGR00299 family) protein
MRIAYLDCFSGISGNMTLGALVDAGLEIERLRAELARLPLSGYELRPEKVRRGKLSGTFVWVNVAETPAERHLEDIEKIINTSDLADRVKQLSLQIFYSLAEVEARIHSTPIERLHFHESDAVDSIVDIVGAVAGLWLMDVERVYASPVHVGRGTIRCGHSILPVPAPATLELLRGVPIYGRDVDAELVTPTGAAILTALVEEFGTAPPMQVERIGYGAGMKDNPQLPNLLRVSIGTTLNEGGSLSQAHPSPPDSPDPHAEKVKG